MSRSPDVFAGRRHPAAPWLTGPGFNHLSAAAKRGPPLASTFTASKRFRRPRETSRKLRQQGECRWLAEVLVERLFMHTPGRSSGDEEEVVSRGYRRRPTSPRPRFRYDSRHQIPRPRTGLFGSSPPAQPDGKYVQCSLDLFCNRHPPASGRLPGMPTSFLASKTGPARFCSPAPSENRSGHLLPREVLRLVIQRPAEQHQVN